MTALGTILERRSAASRKAARTSAMLRIAKLICARCPSPRQPGDCYCLPCRAAYQRSYRKAARKVSRGMRSASAAISGLLCEAA